MTLSQSSLSPEEIGRLKKAATAMALAVGVVMLAMKVAAWAVTDSVSVLTSLMDSILDCSVGIINFVAVRKALSPDGKSPRTKPLGRMGIRRTGDTLTNNARINRPGETRIFHFPA